MKIHHWLWALWGAMVLSMLLKWKIDTYMVVALIILPILIVLLELQDEISVLKEESKHQRKFVMDRFAVLSDKLKDLSGQFEKKVVVDFAEFARSNPPAEKERTGSPKKKKHPKRELPADAEAGIEADNPEEVDFSEASLSEAAEAPEETEQKPDTRAS
ncbi:MAG TPA: hypothetical protein PLP29_16935 [Candidatus Ozemobacteraceae bacterium]|nr:hypothetical protein [Candidatus Ozemobacteraceae bacterium]